jgi:hypothetical protein
MKGSADFGAADVPHALTDSTTVGTVTLIEMCSGAVGFEPV